MKLNLVCLILLCFNLSAQERAYKKILLLMGSRFEITAVSDDEKKAQQSIQAAIEEIHRIEKLISSWDKNSQTYKINEQAGIEAVPVSDELYGLINRCLKVSKLTDGAFDISFAAMDTVWKFDGSMKQLPSSEMIKQAVGKVGYQKIVLNFKEKTVFLSMKGMKIGFGAIGKGYAANRAKQVMRDLGISSGLVNAGGDLIAWGKQTGSTDWKVGIADPKNKYNTIGWLTASDMAVVTSGDYEKFAMIDGKKYAHIIDPRTGYPASGVKSVTIVSPDAELADALATAVFVLGETKGIELLNKIGGIEGLVVNDKDQLITSKNLDLNYYVESDEK